MNRKAWFFILLSSISYTACKQNKPQEPEPAGTAAPAAPPVAKEAPVPERVLINYHFEKKAVWKLKDSFGGYAHKNIIAAINRVDEKHLPRLDSFLVPDQYLEDIKAYMPFPATAPSLKDIRKIIFFSYPTQAFAAYENGNLVLSGPTNMGKKASQTPTGLFFCNWQAKETRSTVDNEWILKWNFNVSNFGGVGFHQYDLPGYPASHSCMRLWAEQAQFLYGWADQWKLQDGKVVLKGTPVIVYGAYPFGKPRPWFVLAGDGKALDISDAEISELVSPHREEILAAQNAREGQAPAAAVQ
ncbi:MAG: L,D-transpeptidase [Chitinophagaceae bacterium]|nr:L,D-transpeptidase [Chitinophagaceae bacterium]